MNYDAVLFDLFGTLVDDRAIAFPGVRACLEALAGDRWAIVTSCGTRFALSLIAHAGLPKPPLLVSADDVDRNKPAPDGYLEAARHFGVVPARALVVEDSLQGIAAAREAGMDVVAVLRGRPPAFARAATFTVDQFSQLSFRSRDGVLALEVP
ncbi:MAG TPA: HAD-IA family hydrolase [Candidatus Acidoferrales bacterium]|nr:HAD-IA family hydrolase [Candidatus Acidoferrales bacterium]